MRMNSDAQSDKITMIDKNGNERLFDIILTFKSEDYHRSYILVAPSDQVGTDELHVQAYAMEDGSDPTNPQNGKLLEIHDDKEWDMVESVLNTFSNHAPK
ncbi:UPF0473 protein [Philodulcilactobacillus myokoensis]|uniref:UPF0473 protein WR164_06640 n=1 Tax=Philodulcilactobacillus myokoensis TaxID=2929573 RepID=A0A9W6ESE4_9LACO|nr:DUF1292 domain-containing protein [Philodulcilactobacillus myokoensis]GLB46685.1 UPF0473 protein [Philodulcilactobacillus myokoensis]